MTLLSDLTLIVPTYNRQNYVLRVMHFWSNSAVTIHVLDGTAIPISSNTLKNFGSNINYHHMPITFQERLYKAIDLVKTPYVALLCDDDFYVPSSLEKCIKYLKEHDDFIACIGRTLGFFSITKNILYVPLYSDMKSVLSPNIEKRMIEHMNPYNISTMYAIHKTETWKKTIATCCPPNFISSCPYLVEIIIELTTCFQGKAKVIDDLMWVRNTQNPCIDNDEWNRKLRFDLWIKNPRYKTEIAFFYENTTSELSKIGNMNRNEVLRVLKLAVNALIEFYGPSKKSIIEAFSNIERQLVKLIPEKQKNSFRSLLKLIIPSYSKRFFAIYSINDGKSINEVISDLKKEGIRVNFKELQRNENYIEKSNFI